MFTWHIGINYSEFTLVLKRESQPPILIQLLRVSIASCAIFGGHLLRATFKQENHILNA